VVKKLGAKQSIILGMIFYCAYVACFLVAAQTLQSHRYWKRLGNGLTLVSAAMGGWGGGILWTAQGVYFAQAAQVRAALMESTSRQDDGANNTSTLTECASYLAGIFAGIYMAMEAVLELLPSVLMQAGMVDWRIIFGIYTIIACLATFGMQFVENYPSTDSITTIMDAATTATSGWTKVLAAWRLLQTDSKMRYLVGFNAAFGFAGAFVHSYVNGEVIRIALHDDQSKYVGALSAWSAVVASFASLFFDAVSRRYCGNKGPVMLVGALSFFGVAVPFLVLPDLTRWGWRLLIVVYGLYGTGRAVFEGTLKAIFAEYFPHEKEGAFANMILQSGLTSTVGFVLTYWGFSCPNNGGYKKNDYCVQFHNGSTHFVLWMELLVVISAVLAFFGYWRAATIFAVEQPKRCPDT
jgi:MFS family permease